MKFTSLSALVALMFTACAHAGGPAPHWEYEGEKGSRTWAQIDPEFKTCGLGKRQSPINIDEREVEKGGLKPIPFSYKAGPAQIVNNGHTIQIDLPNSGSARFEGLEYRLVQFHFHTPSEEKINSINDSNSFSSKLGYFLIAIWMCIIIGFGYAF